LPSGRPPSQYTERVAVCVCTCNRPRLLGRLFAILERLEPGDRGPLLDGVELVVVDNRPDGRARAVCDAWRGRLPVPLRFVEEPEPGISFARNRALAAALEGGAGLVAFVDDDDEPRPDWLRHLIDAQRASGADVVFGTWRHPEGLAPPWMLAKIRFFQPMQVENRNSYGLPAWAGTFNVMLTRRVVEELAARGPVFRPEFALTGGGDTDLFIRAHRAGFAHAVACDSVVHRVWEPSRMTLRGVVRRAFRIGCTRIQLAEEHQGPERVRKLRRRSAWKLARTMARLPSRAVRPTSLAVQLVRAARYAGELYAASGRRFVYYGAPHAAAAAGSAITIARTVERQCS
jgi:GT2 family glycosyltransferase